MKLEEFCKQYDVPSALVYQFIKAGVLTKETASITEKGLNDEEVERLASCVCLYDLGMRIDTIKTYVFLALSDEDTCEERIQLLQIHRDQSLKTVHERKRVMDCIDDILQELKNKTKV